MEIREIASAALKAFSYPDGTEATSMTTQRSALIGFFTGVAQGIIKHGQEWPIPILLENGGIKSKTQFELVEQIFSSGMLCKGQALFTNRTNTFTSALVK